MKSFALIGTLGGVLIIIVGAFLKGLSVSILLQPVALMMVLGGTFFAVILSYPKRDLQRAIKSLKGLFTESNNDTLALIESIVNQCSIARKDGVLALDSVRDQVPSAMYRKGMKYVIDGFDAGTVKSILDSEIQMQREEDEISGLVWEQAGNYAPTIGVMTAVLGLMQVLQKLDDPSRIGMEIATTFVATVYGIGFANLFFIPWGSHIRRNSRVNSIHLEISKIGVLGIQEGANPGFLKNKLEVFATEALDDLKNNKNLSNDRGFGAMGGA